jgi:predicted nuclease with TOPRIM domain
MLGFCLASCGGSETDITQHWSKLEDKLESGLALLDLREEVKETSFFTRLNPFTKDKGDVDKKLNEILEDAVRILDVSGLKETKSEINGRLEQSRELSVELSSLRFDAEMEGADKARKVREKISQLEGRLERMEAEIEASKTQLITEFRRLGVDLDPDEIDALVYSVTGDDDVQLFTVYENVRTITGKLRQAVAQSGESLDLSRRYFGMHVLLLRTLLTLQQEYILRIDDRYLPRLQEIIAENRDIIAEATRLRQEFEDQAARQQVDANRKAAQLTEKTARLYIQYLKDNRERVARSIDRVEEKEKVAYHTYRTVSAAVELVSLMNESDRFFTSLSELQIPELVVFENNDVRMKFRELTQRMAES